MTSEAEKLGIVSRLLDEGKRDTAIATAIGGTRHEARMLIERVRGRTGRALIPAVPLITAADYAEAIEGCWRRSIEAYIEAGALLIRAKQALPHGEFQAMVDENLPFGARTAQRLMAIAGDERLTNPTRVSLLPASWGSAYELTRFDDDALDTHFRDGTIRPEMERQEVVSLRRKVEDAQRRAVVRDTGGCRLTAWPTQQYEIILIDVPRRRNVYSDDTGQHKGPENHYRVMTFEQLLDLRVADIAAPNSMLLYWSTASSLIDDIEIMAEWDFVALRPRDENGKIRRMIDVDEAGSAMPVVGKGRYSSHQIWRKIYPGEKQHGMGLRFWDVHEILLVGLRGKFPGPSPRGAQPLSVFDAPWRGHSVKPDDVADWVDRLHGDKTRIELFRRGPARPGWDVFGNEAEPAPADGAPVDHLARKHLHRALALVAARCGEPKPRDVYLVPAGLASFIAPADAALDALTREEFDLICDLDDPEACKLALKSDALESALQILSEFAATFPDQAEAAE
jgi:N6-adenosine-specific RNA methylase IME4